MSTPTPGPAPLSLDSFWSRVLKQFEGQEVVLKLRGKGDSKYDIVEGRWGELGRESGQLLFGDGRTQVIDYADILGCKEA